MPNLKYIRGDAFTEKHWAEMFSLLRMPQKTVNSLTAGDLLAARTNIANNLKELKVYFVSFGVKEYIVVLTAHYLIIS